jgi:hypothetical protein
MMTFKINTLEKYNFHIFIYFYFSNHHNKYNHLQVFHQSSPKDRQ